MTRDEFLAWSGRQEGRYEFDGVQPVPLGAVDVNHGLITNAIHRTLFDRLRGTPYRALGPGIGLATVGGTVRKPDALVTGSTLTGAEIIVPSAVVVFEVLSRASPCLGWMARVWEYGAVPSIRRCVLVDGTAVGLAVVSPAQGTGAFTADLLTGGDVLRLPEIGVEMPVGDLYEGVVFDAGGPPARGSRSVVAP